MISRIFHVATAGYNAFIMCYWLTMDLPSEMDVKMPSIRSCWWQYLTVWNTVFQHVYFMMCIVDDFLLNDATRKDLVKMKEKLTWARESLFQMLVLPLCMCVFTIFWGIFAHDRELVYPAALDAVIPFWFNHLLHTAIVFFPWAEMLICRRPFEQRRLRFLSGVAVMTTYLCTMLGAAYWQGFWTYPLINLMTPIQKTLFFALTYSVYITAYIIGCKANDKICGVETDGSKGILQQDFRIKMQ